MLSAADRLAPDVTRVAAEVLDGEAIIIDLASGVYYSMTGAGGLLWTLIEARQPLGDVAAAIAARYDVPPAQAHADVRRVAADLLEHGLVVTAPSAPAPPPALAPPPGDRLAYEPPRLHVYRDLGALLALDPPAPGLRDIPWKASPGDPA